MKKYLAILFVALLCSGCNNETEGTITREIAEKAALTEVDGVVNTYTERFDDVDEPHYLFDIVKDGKHYEVKVHQETGTVISSTAKKNSTNTNENNTTTSTDNANTIYISDEEAREIALERVGGGTVVDSRLEGANDDKLHIVTIHHNNKEHEIKIHAISQEIVEENEHALD